MQIGLNFGKDKIDTKKMETAAQGANTTFRVFSCPENRGSGPSSGQMGNMLRIYFSLKIHLKKKSGYIESRLCSKNIKKIYLCFDGSRTLVRPDISSNRQKVELNVRSNSYPPTFLAIF